MIEQTQYIHIEYYNFPEPVQDKLKYILESYGDVFYVGLSFCWVVSGISDYNTDCPYEIAENVINKFLIGQNIPLHTMVYIDL